MPKEVVMTPTAMESGTIAEIDGWPGAMNMPRFRFLSRLSRSPDRDPYPEVRVFFRVIPSDGNLIYDDLQVNDLTRLDLTLQIHARDDQAAIATAAQTRTMGTCCTKVPAHESHSAASPSPNSAALVTEAITVQEKVKSPSSRLERMDSIRTSMLKARADPTRRVIERRGSNSAREHSLRSPQSGIANTPDSPESEPEAAVPAPEASVQRYAIGACVIVKRSDGNECVAAVEQLDPAYQPPFYMLRLANGDMKRAREQDLREDPGPAAPGGAAASGASVAASGASVAASGAGARRLSVHKQYDDDWNDKGDEGEKEEEAAAHEEPEAANPLLTKAPKAPGAAAPAPDATAPAPDAAAPAPDATTLGPAAAAPAPRAAAAEPPTEPPLDAPPSPPDSEDEGDAQATPAAAPPPPLAPPSQAPLPLRLKPWLPPAVR
jgi:hypothetical protein